MGRFNVATRSASFAARGLIERASAVPYASGVRNTTGSTWEFVLNEASDNVKMNRTGETS